MKATRRRSALGGIRWTCAVALVLFVVGTAAGLRLAVRAAEGLTLVALLASLWQLPALAGFEVRRELAPSVAAVGDRVRLSLQVRARGWLPWFHLSASHPPPVGCDTDWSERRAALLARGIPWNVRQEFLCRRRGVFPLGPVELRGTDPFVLGVRAEELGSAATLIVAPRVVSLSEVGVVPRRLVGEIQMRRGLEDELSLAGVRAYGAGDPPRRIHWRQTARTGDLQVRLLDRSAGARAMLLLDLSGVTGGSAGDEPVVETLLSAAASLFAALVERRVHTGLFARDHDRVHYLVPRATGEQLAAAMVAMARMRAAADLDFARDLRQSPTVVPSDAVPVVFCSTVSPAVGAAAVLLGETGRRPMWVQVVRGMFRREISEQLARIRAAGATCHHVMGLLQGWTWYPPRGEGAIIRRA